MAEETKRPTAQEAAKAMNDVRKNAHAMPAEDLAKAKEAAAQKVAQASSSTEPQKKSLRDLSATEISKLAQVRPPADPTEVGNEFIQKAQDETEAVEQTPKAPAPTAADSKLVEVQEPTQEQRLMAAAMGTTAPASLASPKGAKRPFVVRGATIHTAEGRKKPGDKVMLTAAEAKHFNRLGNLAPYIGDDEEDA